MHKRIRSKVLSSVLMMSMALGLCSTPVHAATDAEAAEKTATWQSKGKYEVKIEVPGKDGENLHDEVILMVDGSFSMDEEWNDMKKAIVAIGETVLNGTGDTQLTLMSFGISPNVVFDHVTSVEELEKALPEMPEGLLYGRSATNCDGAFEGIANYIETHDETLNDVNVIFISDGGANFNSIPKDWIACAEKISAGNALSAQKQEWAKVVEDEAVISDASKMIYGEQLEEALEYYKQAMDLEYSYIELDAEKTALEAEMKEMDAESEEYAAAGEKLQQLTAQCEETLAEMEVAGEKSVGLMQVKDESGKTAAQRWVAQIYKDFYEFAGLSEEEEYPVYVAEYAYVDYEKATNFWLCNTFYYVLGYCGIGNGDVANKDLAGEGAADVAAMEEVENMWLVRYSNDWRAYWMENVENTEYVKSENISTLTTALGGVLTDLGTTPYNNVVVTDYMSKWVNLDPESIKIVDNTTGNVIWTQEGGWTIETDIPTEAAPPVTVDLVDPADYEAGGEDVVGNTSGDIYKLTWHVKDGALLSIDSYALVYDVTIDTAEEGFQYDESYPANGNTYMDYTDDNGEEQTEDIDVPDVTDQERSLYIYKYSDVSAAGDPGDGTQIEITETTTVQALANVAFDVYKVCSLKDLESSNGEAPAVVLGEKPTAEDVATYGTAENHVTTMVTGANGMALHVFGDGAADGVYLVVEQDNPAIQVKSEPFFVSLPMTNDAGNGWMYTVHVYPKNDVKPAPTVDKDVTQVGNDTGSFNMDEEITYIIRGEVPEDLANAVKYVLSDTLDTRLDYEGNVSVRVYTEQEQEIELESQYYDLTVEPASEDKGAYLSVALNTAKLAEIVEFLGEDVENVEPEIRVYFNASINADAALGTEIPNDAQIEYTNSTGYEYQPGQVPDEDQPKVTTGGLNILKKSAEDQGLLTGAKFRIAREVKEGETAEDSLVVDNQTKRVVYMSFYATESREDDKVNIVTTDGNGEAIISGLAYGEYYLVEVQAPSGYNLLKHPVKVTIDANSHLDGEEVTVFNSNQFQLPSTGGIGTTIFTVSGMTMLAAAMMVLVMKRRENEEA